MTEETKESKKSVLERLLNFEYILVFVNTKTLGLVLPDYLLVDPSVTLKLSQHFEGRLEIEETKIEAVLRFKGQYFPCTVPMSGIWGVSTPKGSNYFWLESAPEDVLASFATKAKEHEDQKVPEKKEDTLAEDKKIVPFLKRVK